MREPKEKKDSQRRAMHASIAMNIAMREEELEDDFEDDFTVAPESPDADEDWDGYVDSIFG